MGEPDLKDIVNAVSQVFAICKSNVATTMGKDAHAVPRGVDILTQTSGWVADPRQLLVVDTLPAVFRGTNTHIPGLSNTKLEFGVQWTYGGQVGGHGRYIKDARAFVIVDSVTILYTVDVEAKFSETGTPIGSEPVAMLTATINAKFTHALLGTEFSQLIGVRIFGDGSGDMKFIS
jgi:hypothetical protein